MIETIIHVRCPHCQTLVLVPRERVSGLVCQDCHKVVPLVPTKPRHHGAVTTEQVIYCDEQWYRDTYGDWWEFWWYWSGCIASTP